MSLPIYLKKNDNLNYILNIKKKILNTIYSTKFKSSNYSKIYNFNADFDTNFINYIIKECDKFVDKKNKWPSNKKYKSFVPLGQLKNIDTILTSYMYNIGIKIIEKKYELPKWSLQISEHSIININNDTKYHINNDYNYCIALKKCVINIDNKKIDLDIGDGLVFCGKYSFTSENTYLLLCGIKIFGGYEAKCDHNIHPNSIFIKKNEEILSHSVVNSEDNNIENNDNIKNNNNVENNDNMENNDNIEELYDNNSQNVM